jgi:6-pyruvoyltetrahydropterin/6-carboxytetrahydropterin synthase
MKAHLGRRYRMSASHRLHTDAFDDAQNASIYGKCNNPHGHGHNYVVEITVSGQVSAKTGMVCDLSELDQCVRQNVIDRFDKANLNLDGYFSDRVPTTENLCKAIFEIVKKNLNAAHLESVRIEETSNNFFEYAGKG